LHDLAVDLGLQALLLVEELHHPVDVGDMLGQPLQYVGLALDCTENLM